MLNRLEIIGNLGRDPEMNYTPSGKAVTKFSVAVNEGRGTNGGDQETLWLNIVAWEKLGEVCNQYLHKGERVYLAGRLRVREYERREGGKGTAVEMIAEKMVMLSPKGANGTTGTGVADEMPADDIPF